MSSADWLAIRAYVMKRRHELSSVAALSYPDSVRVAGTPLLSTPAWLPARPVDLRAVSLGWTSTPFAGFVPAEPRYSAVLQEHAPPAVFENRPTYRLRAADLASDAPWLSFSDGSYFDGVDVGEGAAHELAAALLSRDVGTRIREEIGDPCDLTRRPANMAVSVLTLRREPGGAASFPLHWRDPAKVGHAGGLYMVVPVGVFQAPGFSLWDSMVREFAEELLGVPEGYDYASLPFARALDLGMVRAYCLGLGVDPLTFATDLMVAVVIDSDRYDEWFGAMVSINDEGRLLERIDFTLGDIERFTEREPMQAAGAAQLRLAWAAREHLLAR